MMRGRRSQGVGAWGARVVLGLGLLFGCADEAHRGGTEPAEGDARVGGRVVSTVDGEPITAAEVARGAREAGLEPRVALRRLQQAILLAREAERRGYGTRPAVRRAQRKAAVQSLLEREVERAVSPEDVSEEGIRRAFEARRDSLARPERRASQHVLAKVADEASEDEVAAARRSIERALRDLRQAERSPEGWQSVLDGYRARPGGGDLEVVVEDLPPVDRDASFAEPYLETLFEAERIGPVDEPVRTDFGWHAIVVTEIHPAREGSLEALRSELRDTLVTEKRHRRLVELVGSLERDLAVERYPARLTEAFASEMTGAFR
ncbi:MAG: peptidyl-prolyl cis-trans isomerase [Myxococcota bacterium]